MGQWVAHGACLSFMQLIVSGVLVSAAVAAGPTDTELYAAYCVGVMDSRITDPASSHPPFTRQQVEAMEAPAKEKRQRFAAYLMALGSPDGDSALAQLLAMQRGRTDMNACMDSRMVAMQAAQDAAKPACRQFSDKSTEANAMGLLPTPYAKCIGDHVGQAMKGLSTLPACHRPLRCEGPDNLPF